MEKSLSFYKTPLKLASALIPLLNTFNLPPPPSSPPNVIICEHNLQIYLQRSTIIKFGNFKKETLSQEFKFGAMSKDIYFERKLLVVHAKNDPKS